MPRMTFAPENRTATSSGFPRLKLEKDERSRILVIEPDPLCEYVHRLEMPRIVNGEVQKQLVARKDGSKYEDYVVDFVGNPICLGDPQVLSEKGIDPDNCPACEKAKTGDLIKPPKRRFAMNVVKYKTKQGGFEVADGPFSVDIVIWAFTDMVFNKIIDFQTEWDDLRKHDLLLGPCTNKDYQKFDISVANKAQWMTDKDRRNIVSETFNNNKADDKILSEACGRSVQKTWLVADIEKIVSRWDEVNGIESDSVDSGDTASLDADLDSLLGNEPNADPVVVDESSPGDDLDILSNDEPEVQEEKKPAAKAKAKPKASTDDKPGSSGEVVSFDSILDEL